MGFFDTPNTPGVQPNMLTPEMIQMLMDEYGVDAETFLGGGMWKEQPPLTVQDTMKPMPEVAPDPTPEVSPQVGVNPENNPSVGTRDTWYAKLLGGLGDNFSTSTPMGEALMGLGMGILGAQNTYGSTMNAIGQGGTQALNTYGYAKRREQIEQYKKDQLVAQKEASAGKRVENLLATAKQLADSGQYQAANKIISSNPAVLESLHLGRGDVLFGPKSKDPQYYVAKETGRVFSYGPDGVTLVGSVDAQPDQGPDPYSGSFTKEVTDPTTGQAVLRLYSRDGRVIRDLDGTPKGQPQLAFDPTTGTYRLVETNDNMKPPGELLNTSYSKFDAASTLIDITTTMDDAIAKSPSSVGFLGMLKSTTLATVGQADAATGGAIKRFVAQAGAEAQRSGLKNADVLFNDPSRSTIEALSDAMAVMRWKLIENNPRGLTDNDLKAARAGVGVEGWLTSPDQARFKIGLARDLAVSEMEKAKKRIAELTAGRAPAGVRGDQAQSPSSSGETPTPKETPAPPGKSIDRTAGAFNAPPPQGMSREAQAAELALRNRLVRAINPETGKTYTEDEITAFINKQKAGAK